MQKEEKKDEKRQKNNLKKPIELRVRISQTLHEELESAYQNIDLYNSRSQMVNDFLWQVLRSVKTREQILRMKKRSKFFESL